MSGLLYYSGQGIISVATRDAAGLPMGFSELGNCPSLIIKPGRAGTRYATQNPIGPVRWGLPDGDVPSYSISVEDLRKENLARFLLSLDTEIAAGSVTNEVVKSYTGKTSPVAHMGLTVVSAVTNGGGTTYSPGTDYSVDSNGGGIKNLGVGIPNGSNISVSYAYAAYRKFGAFTQAAPLVWLKFSGLNTIDGKPVSVDIFKTELPPLDRLDLINEEIAGYGLDGTMQHDTLQSFPTDGQWFRVRFGA